LVERIAVAFEMFLDRHGHFFRTRTRHNVDFRDQYARAREADDGARRKTCGRLTAWTGLDVGEGIAGKVLRCPASDADGWGKRHPA